MESALLDSAEAILSRGEPLTMDSLAEEAGISRSTAYRRSGGMGALWAALAGRGVDESPTTRERILAAVRRVVGTQGLAGVSVESLAGEAGVGTVTVYRLFGDRESLVREALAGVFPARAFEDLQCEDAPVAQCLEVVAAAMIRFAGTYPGLMALILAPASADRAELMRIHDLQFDFRAQLVAFLQSRADAGLIPPGDALERAGAFSGLSLGASLFLHEVRPLSEEDVRPRARRVVRAFLRTLTDEHSP